MERIERARQMLGAPYLHLGRDYNGIDCVGLLVHADNVDPAIVPVYSTEPVNGELEKALLGYYGEPLLTGKVVESDLKVGDVVAMQYKGPTRHVGLVGNYLGKGHRLSLLHTNSMHGRVVEHALDHKWLRRITQVYRP